MRADSYSTKSRDFHLLRILSVLLLAIWNWAKPETQLKEKRSTQHAHPRFPLHHFLLLSSDAEETEYNLNTLRALACEVLATRVVSRAHKLFLDGKIKPNFRYPTEHCLVEKFVCCEQNRGLEGDGVLTYPQNSLELAVDQRLVIFLSSSSVQHVVDDLWKGRE